MKKKILSIVLAFVMVLSFFPGMTMMASAAGESNSVDIRTLKLGDTVSVGTVLTATKTTYMFYDTPYYALDVIDGDYCPEEWGAALVSDYDKATITSTRSHTVLATVDGEKDDTEISTTTSEWLLVEITNSGKDYHFVPSSEIGTDLTFAEVPEYLTQGGEIIFSTMFKDEEIPADKGVFMRVVGASGETDFYDRDIRSSQKLYVDSEETASELMLQAYIWDAESGKFHYASVTVPFPIEARWTYASDINNLDFDSAYSGKGTLKNAFNADYPNAVTGKTLYIELLDDVVLEGNGIERTTTGTPKIFLDMAGKKITVNGDANDDTSPAGIYYDSYNASLTVKNGTMIVNAVGTESAVGIECEAALILEDLTINVYGTTSGADGVRTTSDQYGDLTMTRCNITVNSACTAGTVSGVFATRNLTMTECNINVNVTGANENTYGVYFFPSGSGTNASNTRTVTATNNTIVVHGAGAKTCGIYAEIHQVLVSGDTIKATGDGASYGIYTQGATVKLAGDAKISGETADIRMYSDSYTQVFAQIDADNYYTGTDIIGIEHADTPSPNYLSEYIVVNDVNESNKDSFELVGDLATQYHLEESNGKLVFAEGAKPSAPALDTTKQAWWGFGKPGVESFTAYTAAGTLAEAFTAANENVDSTNTVTYVKVNKALELTTPVKLTNPWAEDIFVLKADRAMVIDLGGDQNVLSITFTGSGIICKGDLTLKNGKIDAESTTDTGACYAIQALRGQALSISNCDIKVTAENGTAYGINGNFVPVVTISDGSTITSSGKSAYGIYKTSGVLKISDSTINATVTDQDNKGYGVYANGDSGNICEVYLSGNTNISGTTAGIHVANDFSVKVYAKDGSKAFSGEEIVLDFEESYTQKGDIAVYDVTDSNKTKFKLTDDLAAKFSLIDSSPAGKLVFGESATPPAPTTYNVNIKSILNGTVTASHTTAKEGDIVTLTATPAEGYVLDEISVTKGQGYVVQVNSNNQFTMPASDVSVMAWFRKVIVPAEEMGGLTLSVNDGTYTVNGLENYEEVGSAWMYVLGDEESIGYYIGGLPYMPAGSVSAYEFGAEILEGAAFTSSDANNTKVLICRVRDRDEGAILAYAVLSLADAESEEVVPAEEMEGLTLSVNDGTYTVNGLDEYEDDAFAWVYALGSEDEIDDYVNGEDGITKVPSGTWGAEWPILNNATFTNDNADNTHVLICRMDDDYNVTAYAVLPLSEEKVDPAEEMEGLTLSVNDGTYTVNGLDEYEDDAFAWVYALGSEDEIDDYVNGEDGITKVPSGTWGAEWPILNNATFTNDNADNTHVLICRLNSDYNVTAYAVLSLSVESGGDETPTFSIQVTVMEEIQYPEDPNDPYVVSNDATVTIVSPAGGTIAQAKTVNGVCVFEGVPSGIYNVKVTKGEKVKTVLVTVDKNVSLPVIKLPLMKINSMVDVKIEVSDDSLVKGASAGGLDELADRVAGTVEKNHNEDVSVEVEMTIDTQMTGSGSAQEQQKIEEVVPEEKKLTFLDITIDLTVKRNGVEQPNEGRNIRDAGALLEIVIPFDMDRKTDFVVYRHHVDSDVFSNEVQVLDELIAGEDPNTTEHIEIGTDTITMYVRYFSTYAIGYTEITSTPTPTPTPNPTPNPAPVPSVKPTVIANPSYLVSITEGVNGGKVESSAKAVAKDKLVTITVTPDKGYELETLSVVDFKGNELALTHIGGGKYTFVMPQSQVSINATFVQKTAICTKGADCPIWPYTDASATAWYHDGVHYCIENGLMNGMTTTQFAPGGTTTRAQIVTLLWRLEGQPYAYCTMSFADVAEGKWYTEAVRWAARNGIVDGYSETSFGPNDSITREQMAAILWRYCQYKGIDVSVGEETNILSYSDAFNVHSWAMSAMQWACGAGVIGGITDGSSMKLDPTGTATRAQAATMLWRFCTEIVNP